MAFDGSSVPRFFAVNTYLGVLCAINLPLAFAGHAAPAINVVTTTYSQIAGQRREPAAGCTASFIGFISPPGANFAENLSDKDECHRRAGESGTNSQQSCNMRSEEHTSELQSLRHL